MRYKWDKKYLYWGITAFAVIAACMVLYGIINNKDTIFSALGGIMGAMVPVFYGFAFAYILYPIENFFEKTVFFKQFKKRQIKKYGEDCDLTRSRKTARVFAIIATLIIALLVVAGVIMIIIPQLVETVQKLVNNSEAYVNTIKEWANTAFADFPDIQKEVDNVINNLNTYLMDWLKTSILPQMSDIWNTVSSGVMGFFSVLFNIFFGVFISIYFLYNKDLFAAQLKKVLFSVVRPRYANAVVRNLREIHRTFGGFLSGKIIESFLIGVLFFFILSIFNFPYAMLCSVIMGVFNIIPMFGPIIGAVPCGFLILMENPLYCLYFVGIVIVIQQLDGNVIGPKILGESTGLSGFWVSFALLVGQALFDFMGLIIGIPLFAVIYSIFKNRVGYALKKKGLPDDSNVYRKVAYIDEETGELISLYEVDEKRREQKRQKELEEQTTGGFKTHKFIKTKKLGKNKSE